MNTSFFIFLIAGILAGALCMQIRMAVQVYHIHQDFHTMHIGNGNRIVTDRLELYKITITRYDQDLTALNSKLKTTISKTEYKKVKKRLQKTTKEMEAVETGKKLYSTIVRDFWNEKAKNDDEKKPGSYRKDLENYIRHSGMKFVRGEN